MPIEVVGYCRVSTSYQMESESIYTQEHAINQFCIRNGLQLKELVKDEEVSGTIPFSRRPGGKRIEALLHEGVVQGVILTKLDRGFRNTSDAIVTIDLWGKEGYAIFIIDFLGGKQLDSRDPIAKAMLSMVAVFAQLDRDMISARTRDKLAYRKEKGKRYTRSIYGYRANENGDLIPEEQEQLTISIIKNKRADGESLRQIAEYLEENHFSTPRGGKRWYASTVGCILNNEIHYKEE